MGSVRMMGLAAGLQLAMMTAQAQGPEPSESSPTRLGPITVTAPGTAFTNAGIEADREEVELTPGGVTLVAGEILDERNISGLADMLRYVPGLFIASDSGGSEIFFSSRGSNLDAIDYDMNGILLLKNGIPVTTADGNNHNRVLNPLSARYAIVARGANGMKYGASTLGGAINFISPTAYDLPGVLLFANGGGHGQLQGRITLSQIFANGFDGAVTLELKRREGWREHAEEDQAGVYGNIGWRIAPSLGTRLYLTYIDSDLELGGSLSRAQLEDDYEQAGTDALAGNFQRNVDTWRVASKTTWQPGENRRLDFGIAFEQQQLVHPIVADFGGDNPFFDGLLIDTEYDNIAATLRYEHQIAKHNLLLGSNYVVGEETGKQYGNNHGQPGDLQTLVDQEADTLHLYVMDRWRIAERWLLIPGLQYVSATRKINNVTITNPPPAFNPNLKRIPSDLDDNYSAVNPRLGLIYQVGPAFDLFANVSTIYEPPTFFVLQNKAKGGGETLAAMEGTVVEVGTRGGHAIGQASRWEWNLAVYYAWIDNEILTTKNEKLTDNNPATTLGPMEARFFVNNADDTLHAGIEALVTAHFALGDSGIHALEPVLSLSINEFRFDDASAFGDNELPAAPGYVVQGEILYRHARGFYAGPTFDVVDERYADFANSYTVDSYTLLGFLAGWSNDRLSVYIEAENLTDEEYVSTHSVVADAEETAPLLRPGAPVAVFAGVEMEFY